MRHFASDEIRNAEEFYRELDEAIPLMEQLLVDIPGDSSLVSVMTQLRFIKENTADGEALAAADVGRLTMGVIASRGMDDFDGLRLRIMRINTYIDDFMGKNHHRHRARIAQRTAALRRGKK